MNLALGLIKMSDQSLSIKNAEVEEFIKKRTAMDREVLQWLVDANIPSPALLTLIAIDADTGMMFPLEHTVRMYHSVKKV